MSESGGNVWRQCSSCKKDLFFGQTFHQCSVSTCTRSRIPLSFCSVACWDAHLPEARHREAWAVEARAPGRGEWARAQAQESRPAPVPAPSRSSPPPARLASIGPPAVGSIPRPVSAPAAPAAPAAPPGPVVWSAKFSRDVLVVVSKLKQYIRERSTMNTSDGVTDVLSDHLRAVCDEAIANAAADGRKTVMDRDVKPVTGRWRVVR